MAAIELPEPRRSLILRQLPDATPSGEFLNEILVSASESLPCIVMGKSRVADLLPARRPLTLTAVNSGRVCCRFDSRELVVDDDTLLVVDSGRMQSVAIDTEQLTELTQVYFPNNMLWDVQRNLARDSQSLLSTPDENPSDSSVLLEGLSRHPTRLSPALRYVQLCVRNSEATETWFEEQAHYLLYLLLVMQRHRQVRLQGLRCVRRATRLELYRRAARAADFIDSHYQQDFGLAEIAAAACLSKFHLLRLFKQVYGVTPHSYKEQRRVLAASRLMRTSSLPLVEIAEHVGYSSRASLRAQLNRWGGATQFATI